VNILTILKLNIMAFKLRSQSPIKQKEDPYVASRIKLAKAKEAPGYKKLSGAESFEEYGSKHPIAKAVVQLADPSGATSYPDVKKVWSDKKTTVEDFTEPLSALPLIGRIPKAIGGTIKLAKSISSVTKIASAAGKINKVTSKVNKAGKAINEGKIVEAAIDSPLNQKKNSPLEQKLSPKATKAKAARDLAYAKTDDRRIKKAHSQRMHRKSPGNKGKDYDHEDGRFESVKQNRGNEGEGTKKESGKKYKIKN